MNNIKTETITITVPKGSKITVDGEPYPLNDEVKLWTPQAGDDVWVVSENGDINDDMWGLPVPSYDLCILEAGNIFPTREYAEALDRKRRAESVIFRYFYERGIDTAWKEGEMQLGVHISHGRLTVLIHQFSCYGSPFYVESKAIAEQAIADIPDAIRTALLGGWV